MVLRWTDSLMIYQDGESAFASLAKDFEEENSAGNRAMKARSASEACTILNQHVNVQRVIFYTHGDVGYVHFPGGGITADTARLYLGGHPTLFRGTGQVLFAGCNTAEGDEGLNFLKVAGRALFKGRGGIIGGTTSKNIFGRFGLFDVKMPFWGSLRLVKLDAQGNILETR